MVMVYLTQIDIVVITRDKKYTLRDHRWKSTDGKCTQARGHCWKPRDGKCTLSGHRRESRDGQCTLVVIRALGIRAQENIQ